MSKDKDADKAPARAPETRQPAAAFVDQTPMPLLEAALNGSRTSEEHPWIPRTPLELASAAQSAVDAGADVVHLHVYDENGKQTLAAKPTSEVLQAVRERVPGTLISLTTSLDVDPDPERRRYLISRWRELPDLVTANMGEPGIVDICQDLTDRGVGIEAGLLSIADAESFVRANLEPLCTRVLVEPLDADPEAAINHAQLIENRVSTAGIRLEQVHHGDGIASWSVNVRALQRGHGIRTGLEDTTVLPDGTLAADNAALVAEAARLVEKLCSVTHRRTP